MTRRLVIAAILAICLGGPILEMFDSWDQTLQDGHDAEANVVVVALCVGVAMAIGTVVVVARIRALASNSCLFAVAPRFISFAVTSLASRTPVISPPAPLRI